MADGYDEGVWDGGDVDPGAREVLGLEAFVMRSSGRRSFSNSFESERLNPGVSLLIKGGDGEAKISLGEELTGEDSLSTCYLCAAPRLVVSFGLPHPEWRYLGI